LPSRHPAAAARTPTFSVDIRAQPLAEALLDLSRRTGAVVIAPAPLVRGRRAPAVSGRMTLAEALTRLLAGADLDFAIGPDGVATIGPRAVVMTRPRDIKLATPPTPNRRHADPRRLGQRHRRGRR
jgi:iron complex outermembrane receptor protein